MMEEWRDIPGFEGRYQVSNIGRIKSLCRKVNSNNHLKTVSERVLVQHKDKKGYWRIELRDEKHKKHCFQVHRLVAIAFIPNSTGKEQVNHKNGQKDNNSVENLEWVSCRENLIHSFEHELRPNIKAVLQYDIDGHLISRFKNCMDAERKTGIKHRTIQTACTRKHNPYAFGYRWEYERG